MKNKIFIISTYCLSAQSTVFETTKPTDKILSASFSSAGGQNLEMSDNRFIDTFRCRKGEEVEKIKTR